MLRKISALISRNQRFIPLIATAVLAFVAYGIGAILYPGMRDPQVFLNIFRNNAYLLISAIGMTFVILTGGIDLSVSGVVALTTVAAAALLREGWNAWLVILLMLVMGTALGAIMGSIIAYMKVQPFIATLAGMWFARGLCFFISDDAIAINNRIYTILGQTRILIPGLSDPVTQTGDYVSIFTVVAMLLLAVAIYIAHYTRFGRTVYAIGGNEGRNEISARLMGLPVERTKVLVYTLNGFCSALAGIALSVFVASGHGLYATGFELDVIASVVMGGTMLTGGEGYVFGTLFGVLVFGVTQTLIQFNGSLSSWWIRIVVGALTLIFIGVQSFLAARRGGRRVRAGVPTTMALRRRRVLLFGGSGVAAVIVLAVIGIGLLPKLSKGGSVAETATPKTAACEFKPFRQDKAAEFMRDGAVITYERNGGPNCIDELYAIYPDGRIIGDDGSRTIEAQVSPAEVEQLLEGIASYGWFTDEMYSTWHTPCKQCYGYYLTVSYQGQEKTVKGVDGGTDAPAEYWEVIALVRKIVPRFDTTQ
ncbi:MAG: sugar ABC transporter permease YjfF [Anaerolineae bacterium]|nr:sugar ABC transporter permease YjfF [Anaerolineae bacterium]